MPGKSIRAFYFFIYAVQGVLFPYLAIWLVSVGASTVQVSALLTATNLSKLISNPLAGYLSDRRFPATWMMAACSTISTFFYIIYTLPSVGVTTYFVAIAMASFSVPPLFPMADRAAVGMGLREAGGFGAKRAWGSIGFAVGTCLGAAVSMAYGLHSVPWAVLGLSSCASGVAISMANGRRSSLEVTSSVSRGPSAPVERTVWRLLCASALLQASNGYLYSTASVEWRTHGLTTLFIAVAWVCGISAEILFFMFGHRLCQRTTAQRMVMIAALATAVRWGLLGTMSSPLVILSAQVLQIFTISMNVMAVARVVAESVPDVARGRAFAVYNAFSGGVFFSIAIAAGGYVRNVWGASGFLAMSALCLFAAGIAVTVMADQPRPLSTIVNGSKGNS